MVEGDSLENCCVRKGIVGSNPTASANALIAQWIERLVAVQKVAGPIPAKRTTKKYYTKLCT